MNKKTCNTLESRGALVAVQRLMRFALLGILPLCWVPGFALSDDQLLDRIVVPLEVIEINKALNAVLAQSFWNGWNSSNSFNFGVYPEAWNEQKRIALSKRYDWPRRYSDEDLKRFLTEFERVRQAHRQKLEKYPTTHKEHLKKNLAWWLNEEKIRQLDALLADPVAEQFWKRNIEYLDRASQVLDFARVILQIAPDRFINSDTTSIAVPSSLDQRGRSYSDFFSAQHADMDFLVHSNLMRPFLPPAFDIEALRAMDLRLHKQSGQLYDRHFQSMSSLDSALATSGGLMFTAAFNESNKLQGETERELHASLFLLGERLRATVDTTDLCKTTRAIFSETSLKAAKVDWQKVRLADDSSPLSNSEAMKKLYTGYFSGCFSARKDAVTARQILESWAPKHNDQGRLGAETHCTLAFWYKHGIGGKQDQAKSTAWIAKARTDVGADCDFSSRPLVDPSDPWRVLN